MLSLNNIDVLVATPNSKIQKFGKFEYPYLSRYSMCITMLHTKKACN